MLSRMRLNPRAQVVVVGVALAGVMAGGTAALAMAPRDADEPATAALATRDLDKTAPPVVPEESDAPSSAAPAEPAPVAPLGALQIPDVVVRSTTPLPPATVTALQGIEGVTGMALLDKGPVQLQGAESTLVGVDPSQFRAFAPQESAASDPLWESIARGDLAVSPGLAQDRSLPLGGDVAAGSGTARIGAIAVFGLASGDVVTTREQARAMGAVPDSVAVLSAPETKRDALEKAVRSVAGDAEVEVLRPAEVAPSQVATTVTGKPRDWRELYIDSARYCPGLSWTVLAAIGQVESAHGKHLGPSSAGALGPMQFLPSTWAAYGVDGDGDGRADIMNPFDAVPGAANYLCRSGAQYGEQGLYDAIFAYNHADWYVRKVLGIAAQYR